PDVSLPIRHPDIRVRSGIDIATAQAKNCSLVVVRLKDAIERGTELYGNNVDVHPKLLQIVLHDGCDLHALGVAGADDNGEFDGLATLIGERAVRSPGESGVLKKLARVRQRSLRSRQSGVQPQFVARCDLCAEGNAASAEDQPHYGRPVNSGRNG